MGDGYRFAAIGPLRVPLKPHERAVDFSQACEAVFAQVDNDPRARRFGDLREAIGLYVFGLSPAGAKRTWPYYVGQARLQTLSTRLFQLSDKPRVYNEIVAQYQRAAPFVYLFPLITPGERLARLGSNKAVIDNAEHMLIGMAMRVNWDLWNVKHRVGMDAFSIDGTPHSDRRRETDAAKRFRTMMAFDSNPKSGTTPVQQVPLRLTTKT